MDIENTLVMQGGAIKSLGEASSGGRPVGRLGGVLCRFSSAEDPDQTRERDFFDGETNFKLQDGMTTPVYYHHGLHAGVGVKEIGCGTLRAGQDGIDIECALWLDDADGARYYREACAGRLAWSSGTAAHLVKRTPVAAKSGAVAHHIDFWPLGLDASLTPHAAEPRNVAVALKSLVGSRQRQEAMGDGGGSLAWSYTDGTDGEGGGGLGLDAELEIGDGLARSYTDGLACKSDELPNLCVLEVGQLEGSRLVDHTARLRDAIAEYADRIARIGADRAAKSGRGFSVERHDELTGLLGEIRGAADGLDAVLLTCVPDGGAAAEMADLECRVLGQQMRVQGLELDELLLSLAAGNSFFD